jgi:hypothetical protein
MHYCMHYLYALDNKYSLIIFMLFLILNVVNSVKAASIKNRTLFQNVLRETNF